MKKLIIFLIMCASARIVFAQQISPSAYTSGGGSYGTTDISIGQSFGNEINGVGVGITQGIFQPKASQTITFNALPNKNFGDAPFTLNATASSGLTVSYTSSNESVATISGNNVTIVGAGTTIITASQAGNVNYKAATNVLRSLVVSGAGVANTKVRTIDCGSTVITLAYYIYCDAVSGASNYEWEFTTADFSFTRTKGNSNTGFYLSWVTGIEYNKTYNIRVRAYKNGIWGSFSTACQVTTGAIPTTQLSPVYCGSTTSNLAQYIYCDLMSGASDYEWEFTNSSTGFFFTRIRGMASNSMSLSWIEGLVYEETYDVRIKAKVGTQWSDFGSVCTITTPSIPSTKLKTLYSGTTVASLSHYFYCDAVAGATDYEWEFVNSASNFSATIVRGLESNSMSFSYVNGAKLNTTYDVRVRVQIGTQWGNFANVSPISTPGVSLTKVRADFCGITATSLTQNVYCDAVKGASDYEWKFENTASSFSFTKLSGTSNTVMHLSWITNIANNTTYDVSVKAKVAGIWGNFGTVCQITTPLIAGKYSNIDMNNESVFDALDCNLEISAYPNPVSNGGSFVVEMKSNASLYGTKINIYNIIGQNIYTKQINVDANKYITTIEQNNKFTSGLFIIHAELYGKVKRLTLIVE